MLRDAPFRGSSARTDFSRDHAGGRAEIGTAAAFLCSTYDCGAVHGRPEHTSLTTPLGGDFRKSDFCCRASGELRGSGWGSCVIDEGAVLVVGGVTAPLSQTTIPEPSNG